MSKEFSGQSTNELSFFLFLISTTSKYRYTVYKNLPHFYSKHYSIKG